MWILRSRSKNRNSAGRHIPVQVFWGSTHWVTSTGRAPDQPQVDEFENESDSDYDDEELEA